MCGLCGFGLADAELVLGRDMRTGEAVEQSVTDGSQTVVHPTTQSPIADGVIEIQRTTGPVLQPADGFVANLLSRVRQAVASQPSPSHGL